MRRLVLPLVLLLMESAAGAVVPCLCVSTSTTSTSTSTTTTTLPLECEVGGAVVWSISPDPTLETSAIAALWGEPGTVTASSNGLRARTVTAATTIPVNLDNLILPSDALAGAPMFVVVLMKAPGVHGVFVPADANVWTLLARVSGTAQVLELWASTLTNTISGANAPVGTVDVRDGSDAPVAVDGSSDGMYPRALTFTLSDPLVVDTQDVPGGTAPFTVQLPTFGRQYLVGFTAAAIKQHPGGLDINLSWLHSAAVGNFLDDAVQMLLENILFSCTTSTTTTSTTSTSTTTTSSSTTTTTSSGSTTTSTTLALCLAAVPRTGSTLYTLNPNTAATVATLTLTPSGDGYNGLARHPGSGVLYALYRATGTQTLMTVNEITGVLTGIGTMTTDMTGLAFKNDGTLFAIASNSSATPFHLFQVDTSTAVATDVATLGNSGSGNGFAVRPSDGFLYRIIADTYPVTVETATKIDLGTFTETVAATLSGETVGNYGIQAAGVVSGVFFYSQQHNSGPPNADNNGHLYTVNLSTGAATSVGVTATNMKGLANAPCPP